MIPTIADRLLVKLPRLIERQRAALEATVDLSSVTIVVQVGRYGPDGDRLDLRFEAAQPKPFKDSG